MGRDRGGDSDDNGSDPGAVHAHAEAADQRPHRGRGARMKKLAIAYDLERAVDLIGPAQRARLAALCEVVNTTPLASFDGVDLSQIEILLTSWGCPRIDSEVLARAP